MSGLMEGVSRRFRLRRVLACLIWLGLSGLAWAVLAGCGDARPTLFSNVASVSQAPSSIPPQPTASPTAPASQPNSIQEPVAARDSLRSVPILMYHYVRNNPDPTDRAGDTLSVSPARFEEQMTWLTEHGYEAVRMVDLLRAWQGELALPPKTVVLTFDDGYADAYTAAAPILARHGFRGTVFVVNRFVGKPGYLSLEQLQSLKAAGWEIGFHSRSHINLTGLGPAQLQAEVVTAVAELRQLVDAPVLSFAYPSGRYNPQVGQALKQAGVPIAVTTQWGTARPQGDWLLQPRLRIAGQLGIAGFAALFRTP